MLILPCQVLPKSGIPHTNSLVNVINYYDVSDVRSKINLMVRQFHLGCEFGSYGDNCRENCTCILQNTEACNPENGECTCKSGWQGDDCSLDVNECIDTDSYFCPTNSYCDNADGTYRCVCDIGFEKSGTMCIGMNST